jgi:hypothetical protein
MPSGNSAMLRRTGVLESTTDAILGAPHIHKSPKSTGPRPWCFFTVRDPSAGNWKHELEPGTTLRVDHALALSQLISILGCGEEAASLAFSGLASSQQVDVLASIALQQIAEEERFHEKLMQRLAALMPKPSSEVATRAARAMHVRLSAGGIDLHLARIAALDAAVCTILSRLLHADGPVGHDPVVRGILGKIRRDEARHVAVSRALVLAMGVTVQLRDECVIAREALAKVLQIEADAFEALHVDPDKLFRDVCKLPDGLLRQ